MPAGRLFPRLPARGGLFMMSRRRGAPAQSLAEFFARQILPQPVRLAVWLALSLAAAGCASAPSSLVAQRLQPCPSDRGLPDAYCGTLSVFEDRSARAGRRIDLNVVVLPARSEERRVGKEG